MKNFHGDKPSLFAVYIRLGFFLRYLLHTARGEDKSKYNCSDYMRRV